MFGLRDYTITVKPSTDNGFVTERINTLLEPARTALTAQSKMVTAAFPKVAKICFVKYL